MESKKAIFNKLLQQELVFLDGAMGTMIIDKLKVIPKHIEEVNITNQDIVFDIHQQYIEAGANIIYANTFNLNSYKYEDSAYDFRDLIKKAIEIAKEASQGRALVALDLGPIGAMVEPSGSLTFEEAYEIYKDSIMAGSEADLVVIETMSDLYELKAAVLAVKENSKLPLITSFTFEKNGRSFSGCSVETYASLMEGLDVDLIGVNCSLGPLELEPIVKRLRAATTKEIAVKANAGLPDPSTGEYLMTNSIFYEANKKFMNYGVKAIGGCCGTIPEYIKSLTSLKLLKYEKPLLNDLLLSTGLDTMKVSGVKIVGERINPTGKKRFKEALTSGNYDYILNLAIQQVEANADILDVNVGVLEIDEPKIMAKIIKLIQSIVEVPLQIDSSNYEAIEAGLRVYNGKPIVNSVNGEVSKLEKILPIVKKYGASVIALTIDENGIPETAEQRYKIAEKILTKALSYGIKKENLIIDCLTLTVASSQNQVAETLKAMVLIKERLGLKLTLGVSNISFGLPERKLMNQTFLTLAMQSGLDLAIINPNIPDYVKTITAFNALNGIDKDCKKYIDNCTLPDEKGIEVNEYTIEKAITKGLSSEVAKLVKNELITKEALDIVDNFLIPALDVVGYNYENGKIYLPQLIKSAEAAAAGFEVIRSKLKETNQIIEKGTIVLCTVKGDVHDIGKNIVKVILENYGYSIIDLGRDVEISKIVEAAIENNVKLVGLSALMTTTSVYMRMTIEALKEAGYQGKIIVGGAVVTASFAKSINADYYAKDAKEAIKIASEVFMK